MSLKNIVLVALSRGELSGYDITKRFDTSLSHVWYASHQQVYRELKSLEEKGLIGHREIDQEDKPSKKLYSLTDSGEKALDKWLNEELAPEPTRSKETILAKCFAGDYLDLNRYRKQLECLKAEYQNKLKALTEIEKLLEEKRSSNDKHWVMVYLALRRGILSAQTWIQWLDEADATLNKLIHK